MFLLVLAYPGCPGETAVKWLLLFVVVKRKESSLLLYARLPNANAVGKSIIISLLGPDLCGSGSTIQPNIQLTIQQ